MNVVRAFLNIPLKFAGSAEWVCVVFLRRLVSFFFNILDCFLTALNLKVESSSEMLVTIYQLIWRSYPRSRESSL